MFYLSGKESIMKGAKESKVSVSTQRYHYTQETNRHREHEGKSANIGFEGKIMLTLV